MPKLKQSVLPGGVLDGALEVWSQARKHQWFPVTGRSMLPLLRDGDRVLVAHGCACVRQGTIVAFWRDGDLIVHRVLRVARSQAGITFITKGDNIAHCDHPLSRDQLVGRVLIIQRGDRVVSLDTPAWRLSGWLIANGTLLWLTWYRSARTLKHKLLGTNPYRLTALLCQGIRASGSLFRNLIQAILWR